MAKVRATKTGRTGRKRWSGNCITRPRNIWRTGICFMNARKRPGKRARLWCRPASGPIMPRKSRRTSTSCRTIIFARSKSETWSHTWNCFGAFMRRPVLGKARLLRSSAGSRSLRKALDSEAFDLSALLEQARKEGRRPAVADMEFPSRVSIENQADPYFTLIEIQTPDRIGLLHDLLQCLSRNEIDIALARISTESGAAIDTFYVTDRRSHAKLTGTQRMNALHRELHEAAFRT